MLNKKGCWSSVEFSTIYKSEQKKINIFSRCGSSRTAAPEVTVAILVGRPLHPHRGHFRFLKFYILLFRAIQFLKLS